LLDLASETSRPIAIQVPADLPEVRTKLKDVSKNIKNFALSPSGKRALFEARGEIFTVPEKHGSIRNLTNTSGAAERFPAWSPDGKYVAYFCDRGGEYELYIRSGDGKADVQRLTTETEGFRYAPRWSPDSKRLAYIDNSGTIFVVDIAERKPQMVDQVDFLYFDEQLTNVSYSWSPDSRWLAYSKDMPNKQNSIMIYDANDTTSHQVTSDFYNDTYPVFGEDGKYLFFYSNRTFSPVYSSMDTTWIYPNSTNIYAVTLRRDIESPVAPRSDEEEGEKEDKKKDKDKDKGPRSEKSSDKDDEDNEDDNEDDKDDGDEKEPEPVEIDFDDIERRVVKLPVEAGNFGPLRTAKGKLVFLRRPPAGAAKPSSTLFYYDLEEREEKTVISGINAYELSADGKKVIYRSKSIYGIIDLAKDKKVGDGKITTDKLKAWINPRKEWGQIFKEAWRVQRDYFYDPGMHGLDWGAIKRRYEALLVYVVDRADLNYVIGEMIGELNASHTYVRGGDLESGQEISVGLLGCDFALDKENNAYRISTIYEGAVWDAQVRSPLRQPGVDVNEGDYLLAVNGQELDTSKDPWAAFQGLAGEVVTLTIGPSPDVEDGCDIIVKTMSSEFRLRNLAWIESNRRKVEEATDGRIGYVYVPDTQISGQNELVRQFTPQHRKDGLIIDERFNSGGQLPDRFIELMNRPIYNYWARRHDREWQSPFVSHVGPKVMLINQWSGSGGDLFPYYFRKAGLGPLVGTRTWGGLIGITHNPRPIDGGWISAPAFSFWNTEGDWEVEGWGVDPDYKMENAPDEMVAGRDPQLEKAIEVILELLEKQPTRRPKKPAYPDRSDRIE